MTEKLTNQIGDALNLLSQANEAMINAIIAAVKEDGSSVSVEETIDENCGYTELRFIRFNEDGDLCMFDDADNELYLIEDLSADQLYDICLKIS